MLSVSRFFFIMFFSSPLLVKAQSSLSVGTKLENPIGANSIQQFITDILGVVVDIGVPIAILFIIYAGFLFVTAQGNETKLNKAKSAFMWAVIGAAVLLAAEVIARAIEGTINQI